MQKTAYAIYYIAEAHDGSLCPRFVLTHDLTEALQLTEFLRKNAEEAKYSFITMASENVDRVGKDGVDSIKNGLCPDGIAYDWVKRRPPTK